MTNDATEPITAHITGDTSVDTVRREPVRAPECCERAGECVSQESDVDGTDGADGDGGACGAPEWFRELVVALYRQGRSARDVSGLVETMTAVEVTRVVRAAGVARRPPEAASLASQRLVARNAIMRADLNELAVRWMAGEEVEDLATEMAWPPDLLWDALADTLSATPSPDSTSGPAAGRRSAADPVDRVECVGVCTFRCAARCALTTGNVELRLPGEPAHAKRSRRREGIPYARTGLDLPTPGPHSRWGP